MMKPNQLIFCGLLLFSMASCSEEDLLLEEPDTNHQHSSLALYFATPPIDLQSLKVQFAENVPYDQYDKTQFDIFLPNSTFPTGIVVFIHGGGFGGGDKAFIYHNSFYDEIIELLSKNVAVATINYRLIEPGDNEGVLKSLNDSRRAIQYIRFISNELNIDRNQIVLYGSSAGASTALWIATKDEQKDENNLDPVLRESSRVKGIALKGTQSSLDIEKRWLGDVFLEFGSTLDDILETYGEDKFLNFYGISTIEDYHTPVIDTYRANVDMLSFLSSDDPEIWVENTGQKNGAPKTTGSFNHHPFHAREIKEFADAVGVKNVTIYGNPILFNDSNNDRYVDFLLRKLGE